MTPAVPTFAAFLREQYGNIFLRPWPVIPSAFIIAALNVFLFAFDRPWTASDGLRNWGDGLLKLFGVAVAADLLPPTLYSGSILNFGLLLGGLGAALLSREFAVRPAPVKELIRGASGGLLMGMGAMLSFGCNIGGFFSALSALSASGVAMMVGLIIGAFGATKYLMRESARMIFRPRMALASPCEAPAKPAPESSSFRLQPFAGAIVGLAALGVGLIYFQIGHGRLAVFWFFGVAFGVVFQRSRFCLVNAFREPFMSGQSEHCRAAALALLLCMIGFAVLKATDLKDATEWVFPSFWMGAMVGGILFGFGMVIAGGCGAGSIWRVGEGHVKLVLAVFCFAIGASLMRLTLLRTDVIRQLGDAVFLPDHFGWAGALWAVAVLLLLCYLVAAWNERKKTAGAVQV